MNVVIGIFLFLAVVIFGTRKTFTSFRFSENFNLFYLTGMEFLLAGLFLSEHFIGFLNRSTLEGLNPFIGLGLGWTGLLFGMQFSKNRLIRFPGGLFVISFIQSVFTFIIVFLVFFFMRELLYKHIDNSFYLVIVLAIIASCSSQTILGLLSFRKQYKKNPVLFNLRIIAGTGDVWGLILLGIIFCMHKKAPLLPFNNVIPLQWLLFSVIIAGFFGLTVILLARFRFSKEEMFLVMTGIILFTAGISLYYQLSPLFICMIGGIIIANFCREHQKIENIMLHAEKPVYLIFLILVGAAWKIFSIHVLLLALGYVIVRIAGKYGGFFLPSRFLFKNFNFPNNAGLALTSEGGMAIAMIMNIQIVFPSEASSILISSLLAAIVISELISPIFIHKVIDR